MKRSCLGLAAAAGVCLVAGAAAALEDRVVVVTSYPDEMATLYETAFERAHPGTDVRILWQHARDAVATFATPGRGGADVYWTPSLATFPALADAGVLRPLAVDRAALPGRIGAQLLSDPRGRFEAFEVAGYGIATDPGARDRLGLPAPRRWRDLADPRYAGHVAMPVAGRVGFSPALYDVILQGQGWEEGWALLSEIAGNARLIESGGGVLDAVSSGMAAGLTIDFFVRSAIANGHPVAFAYPEGTAFLPAHVALVDASPHPEAARAFADFVLGPEGQALLFHPDVGRHPVRPAVYASAPPGTLNPFARPADATVAHDGALGIARAGLVVALFDRLIAERHDRLVALWDLVHRAEAAAGADPQRRAAAARARALAGLVPVDAALAGDPAFLAAFRERRTAHDGTMAAVAGEADWSARLDAAHAEAAALAEGVVAAVGQGVGQGN